MTLAVPLRTPTELLKPESPISIPQCLALATETASRRLGARWHAWLLPAVDTVMGRYRLGELEGIEELVAGAVEVNIPFNNCSNYPFLSNKLQSY